MPSRAMTGRQTMLFITLLISTLCLVRLLTSFDPERRHRQNGFAVAPIDSARASSNHR